jgi:hypothetical protein
MARILIGNIKGPKGDTGPAGVDGAQGPAGSDASVTAANIESALGYKPANAEHLHDEYAKISEVPKTPADLSMKTEAWTFTYEDGSTETKELYVK